MAVIRWRQMPLLGQEHWLSPSGAQIWQVTSPIWTWAPSSVTVTEGSARAARSFLARLTVPLLHRPIR